MASLAASAANTIALPARSATIVRIAGLVGVCAATLVAPALLLVWMPIVLGVPHIASDVRYLVLPLPRWQVMVALAACAALVALKAASLATGVSLLRAEMVVVAAWLLAALAGSSRTVCLGALAGVIIIALPLQFVILAAFAYNFVAVAAWLVVRRPDRRHALVVLAAIAAAVALLLLVGPAVASATGGDATRWLEIDRAASVMFGGVPLPTARALLIAFAFLQAVHYAIWLAWIRRGAAPCCAGSIEGVRRTRIYGLYGASDEARMDGASEPTHRNRIYGVVESALSKRWPRINRAYGVVERALSKRWPRINRIYGLVERALSKRWRLVVGVTTAVVVGAAFVDAAWTRTTYLALATFHIYLELVVLAAIAARRWAR